MALKPKITREFIKEKIGDANVFNFYFGDFDFNKSFHSIFREDKKKSTGFFVSKNGSIVYNDFTTSEKWDFVTFVMKLYGINYYKALEQIAIDFNLIPGERSKEKPAIVKHIYINKPKPEKVIKVGVIKFRKHHLDYWKQYEITEEELKDNNVYAVNNMYINGWKIPTIDDDLRFAYLITDENNKEYLKIYSPYDKEYKWVSSAPLNVPFGLNDLPISSDTLIITKGQKDRILLKKYFTDVLATQNESSSALKPETADALKKVYKKIYVWFDNDNAGKEASKFYVDSYGFIPVFTPNKADIKDPSDFVAKYGLAIFEQYLKYIKLLDV